MLKGYNLFLARSPTTSTSKAMDSLAVDVYFHNCITSQYIDPHAHFTYSHVTQSRQILKTTDTRSTGRTDDTTSLRRSSSLRLKISSLFPTLSHTSSTRVAKGRHNKHCAAAGHSMTDGDVQAPFSCMFLASTSGYVLRFVVVLPLCRVAYCFVLRRRRASTLD